MPGVQPPVFGQRPLAMKLEIDLGMPLEFLLVLGSLFPDIGFSPLGSSSPVRLLRKGARNLL